MTTKIEWAETVWNPVTGCTRVSAGCDNCYAVAMTRRLAGMGQTKKYGGLVDPGKGHFNGTVRCHEDVLNMPLKLKKPQTIFVNSMSDLFHKDVPDGFIDKVFVAMAMCPRHTFIILTKRPERMAEYLADNGWAPGPGGPLRDRIEYGWLTKPQTWRDDPDYLHGPFPLPNVIIGTSIEDQATADERIPHLLNCPAAVRMLSVEPLLGAVDSRLCPDPTDQVACDRDANDPYDDSPVAGVECPSGRHWVNLCTDFRSRHCGLDWVIVGGESGPKARPMHPDWVRSIRDQCQAAGVPFFFKQWGKLANNPDQSDPTAKENGGSAKGGRTLDGRVWDERPEMDSDGGKHNETTY